MLYFGKATKIFAQTLPFVLLRAAAGILLGIATIVYFGFIFWLGWTLLDAGTISGWVGIVGLLLAVIIFVGIWRLFSRYVLYLVKAAHIAVIAEILETGDVPPNQVKHGIGTVRSRFAQTSALFGLDQLIKGVLRQFNNRVVSFSRLFSFSSGLQSLIRILGKAIALAASYIDEAILAYMFTRPDENPWRAARDGVVLYGKNWKPVLLSTLAIIFGMYAVAFVGLIALTPLASVLGGLSTGAEVAGWAVVFGIFLTGYVGLLKPWVKTVVITTFLIESRDDTPDSETMDRIAARSDRFRELTQRAGSESSESMTTEHDDEFVTPG